MLKSKGLPS
jgi:hypothetical protein